MTFVRRNPSHVVIRQIPFLLLSVTALFGFPFLSFSLFHLLRGTDADGTSFCLVFGLFILWLFLEFVATRERIDIDLDRKTLTRRVSGVFKHKKQEIDLRGVTEIGLELKRDSRGRKRQYLYLNENNGQHLVNSPSKVYMDHARLGRLLSELTLIPYVG